MNPWLSSQKTFNRISIIVRNELYNAYGAVTDQPEQLSFVSPCSLENYKDWLQDGFIFAELEASFSRVRQGRQYHAVGLFCVREEDRAKILEIAHKARAETLRTNKSKVSGITYLPLRLKTVSEMTVFDLMTGSAAEQEDIKPARSKSTKYGKKSEKGSQKKSDHPGIGDYLEKYSDHWMQYKEIHMPEVQVEVYYSHSLITTANLKLRRVIRYHHLARDFIDEVDYPPTQEYLLYSYKEHAYMSHCPNRWPDFQQLIELDSVPVPANPLDNHEDPDELYKDAVSRGVIVHLPQIEVGGRPLLKRGSQDVCKDPISLHAYNAVSWSDQGAFTGDMISVNLEMVKTCSGKRWFDGTNINKHYHKSDFPMLFNGEGGRRVYPEEEVEEEDDDSYSLTQSISE